MNNVLHLIENKQKTRILDVKNQYPCAKNTTITLIYVGTFPTGIGNVSHGGQSWEKLKILRINEN